ncbi:hypothetical protein LG634_32480 [Streptomyces bambusae]|uniref:hypothetical protein n=1 Tax=Streptomyces bambusae TaxID=1550616 RepID=UPI001CFFC478|nr:hypothetical protein [Streptomyces bambusae]MCB5169510.1 hypothetical protein [Streptomyces bambusae]
MTERTAGHPAEGAIRRLRRAWPAAAAAVLAAAAVAGCGSLPTRIQGTDVIEAGQPAVVTSDRPNGTLLFFIGENGRLTPALREGLFDSDDGNAEGGLIGGGGSESDSGYLLPVTFVMSRLLAGPADAERAAGLHTAVPFSPKGSEVKAEYTGRQLNVRFTFPVTELSATARAQLVCTAYHAGLRRPVTAVVLLGPDGETEPARCDETDG